MTISNTSARQQFTGNGAQLVFDVSFHIYVTTDVMVTVLPSGSTTPVTKTLTTHYLVTNIDTINGTFKVDFTPSGAPANGDRITVTRRLPQTQTRDYVPNDKFPADSHEQALDRIVLSLQEFQDSLNLAMRLDLNVSPSVSSTLPFPEASKFLAWDAAALKIINASSLDPTVPVSTYMQTVLDDTTAADARATLGLTIGSQVQAYDAELAALAGLTSSADKVPYFSGSGTAALADLTSFARTVIAAATAAATRAVIHAPLRGHIAGLTLANNGTDANNDIDIAAGEAADSTHTSLIQLNSLITKRLDANWAVGSNQGGLDTGTEANSTWYHVFVIRRPDTGGTDVLFSTSATSPTMPTSYTEKRRIGAIYNNSSGNIDAFTQFGDIFDWTTPITDATNPSTGLLTIRVPSGVSVAARVHGEIAGLGSGEYNTVTLRGANQQNTTAQWHKFFAQSPDALVMYYPALLVTNTSSQIYINKETSYGTVTISTGGWIDNRGRDD
jgi:hypothetical protein